MLGTRQQERRGACSVHGVGGKKGPDPTPEAPAPSWGVWEGGNELPPPPQGTTEVTEGIYSVRIPRGAGASPGTQEPLQRRRSRSSLLTPQQQIPHLAPGRGFPGFSAFLLRRSRFPPGPAAQEPGRALGRDRDGDRTRSGPLTQPHTPSPVCPPPTAPLLLGSSSGTAGSGCGTGVWGPGVGTAGGTPASPTTAPHRPSRSRSAGR